MADARIINEYYEKGLSALSKKNYDYAIEMLIQVVQENPHFLDARKELHRAAIEKFKTNPPSMISQLITKVNNIIPCLLALYYEMRKQGNKSIAFFEDLFKTTPTSKFYLKKISSIALKNNWPEIAIVSLESLFEMDKTDSNIATTIGKLYRDLHNIEKASEYLRKSLKIRPHNQKVSKILKDLEALKTIKKGGWEKKGDYRSKINNEAEAKNLESQTKLKKDDDINQNTINTLKENISKNPEIMSTWTKLFDQYLDLAMFPEAKNLIIKAKEKFPTAEQISSREETLVKKELKEKISAISTKLENNPNDTALKEELKITNNALTDFNITTLKNKVRQYPNNLALKFELGEFYFENNQFDNAIAEFQQSIKDPALHIKGLNSLGLCFFKKNMFDLAILQFNKALEKIPTINETSKEIIYNLGTALEKMGNTEQALFEFKKIYEVDISYLDVGEKIEEFYSR